MTTFKLLETLFSHLWRRGKLPWYLNESIGSLWTECNSGQHFQYIIISNFFTAEFRCRLPQDAISKRVRAWSHAWCRSPRNLVPRARVPFGLRSFFSKSKLVNVGTSGSLSRIIEVSHKLKAKSNWNDNCHTGFFLFFSSFFCFFSFLIFSFIIYTEKIAVLGLANLILEQLVICQRNQNFGGSDNIKLTNEITGLHKLHLQRLLIDLTLRP